MSALPAYRHYADRSDEYQPTSSRISVIPGSGRAEAPSSSTSIVFLAKVAAAIIVVIAVLGFVRVTLSSATVTTALETQELSSQISTVRSEGSTLEVSHSALANPTRIRNMATAMGMAPAESVTYIDLNNDLIATDADGNLSLSGSVARVISG